MTERNRRKVLLIGRNGAGKTSMRAVLFSRTRGVEAEQIYRLAERFELHCGTTAGE